jgi:hypothetical protein
MTEERAGRRGVGSAAIFATVSIISSASSVSTLSDPPGAGGYSAKKSSISSTITQWRQGRSCSFSYFPFGRCKQPPASGSTLRSDIAYLPRAFGHSADTSSPQAGPSMAKPLKLLVGAQGLEPWTR